MADHETLFKLAAGAVTGMKAAGKMIATAESCTGGWIAKAITDVSGSSAVFAYGVVSYSNGAKASLLGVSSETLETHGAVSEQTVCEMAEGVMNMSGADLAVAVSGIAGPDGGTPQKPVGTVWFAWAARDGSGIRLTASRQQFPGDREHIRELTVACALQGVIDRVRKP